LELFCLTLIALIAKPIMYWNGEWNIVVERKERQLMGNGLYIGLSGLTMAVDAIELGDGLVLRKTYAHLMAPLIMAFQPAPPDRHHPGPWKTVHGGQGFDVTAEIFVPIKNGKEQHNAVDVAETITFLVRIFIDPAVTMSVLSNHSVSLIASVPDRQANLIPLEVSRRYFPLCAEDGRATVESLEWIKRRWQLTHKYVCESSEFALAVEAFSNKAQFQDNSALILVSLWAALEALFSPSTSELRFRVSAPIAAYLESPGTERAALQKEVAKLYDKRSSAVHGVPKHDQDDVVSTLLLLRRVLMTIIENGKIPTKEELEAKLFGVPPELPSRT